MSCWSTYSYPERVEVSYEEYDASAVSLDGLALDGAFSFTVSRNAVGIIVGLDPAESTYRPDPWDLPFHVEFSVGEAKIRRDGVTVAVVPLYYVSERWSFVRSREGATLTVLRYDADAETPPITVFNGEYQVAGSRVYEGLYWTRPTDVIFLQAYLLHGQDRIDESALEVFVPQSESGVRVDEGGNAGAGEGGIGGGIDESGVNLAATLRWAHIAREMTGTWQAFAPARIGTFEVDFDDEVQWWTRIGQFKTAGFEDSTYSVAAVAWEAWTAQAEGRYIPREAVPMEIGRLITGATRGDDVTVWYMLTAIAFEDTDDVSRTVLGAIVAWGTGSEAIKCGARIVLPGMGFIYQAPPETLPVVQINARGNLHKPGMSQDPALISYPWDAQILVETFAPTMYSPIAAPYATVSASAKLPKQGATVSCGISETIVSPKIPSQGVGTKTPQANISTVGAVPSTGAGSAVSATSVSITPKAPVMASAFETPHAAITTSGQVPATQAVSSVETASVQAEGEVPSHVALSTARCAQIEARGVAPYSAVEALGTQVITMNLVSGGVTEYSLQWSDIVVIDDVVYGLAANGIYKLSPLGTKSSVVSSVLTGELSFGTSMGKRCAGVELDTDSSTTLAVSMIDAANVAYPTQLKAGAPSKRTREYNAPRGVLSTRFAFSVTGSELSLNGIKASVTEGTRK